jgi:hypothetical protein
MTQTTRTLWIAQRTIAGILYMLSGAVVLGAVALTFMGAFTVFHVIPSVLMIVGMIKLAQYPFKEVA